MESIRFQKTFKYAQASLLTKNLHISCCPYILPYVIILNGAAQQGYTYKLATKIPFIIINYDYPFITPAIAIQLFKFTKSSRKSWDLWVL